jgi:hypothetical protein
MQRQRRALTCCRNAVRAQSRRCGRYSGRDHFEQHRPASPQRAWYTHGRDEVEVGWRPAASHRSPASSTSAGNSNSSASRHGRMKACLASSSMEKETKSMRRRWTRRLAQSSRNATAPAVEFDRHVRPLRQGEDVKPFVRARRLDHGGRAGEPRRGLARGGPAEHPARASAARIQSAP